MKKSIVILILLIVFLGILFLFYILNKKDLDNYSCKEGGGVSTMFNDGCEDSCYSERNRDIDCTMAISGGCDCGPDMCWEENKCVPNYSEELKTLCELGGAAVSRFEWSGGGDQCNKNENLSFSGDMYQCDCGTERCWNGEECVND